MFGKPMIQEVQGGNLGAKGFTIEGATVMIHNQAIASLAIQALVTNPITICT
jgi:hypothetical protein